MLSNLLYFDVAAFSAVTSAIAAIGVAIAAPILYYWKKVKKGVCKTLHIDENKNKEVEEELVVTDESVSETEMVAETQSQTAENTETIASETKIEE